MSNCVRIGGWEGDCKNEALPGKRFCEKDKFFEGKSCSHSGCDKPVTSYCICAGSLVCGRPLCSAHSPAGASWCPRCSR